MGSEVFFTAIPQPYPEDLRNLFLLLFTQALVQRHGFIPVDSAGMIFMRVPIGAGEADQSTGLLDRIVGIFNWH